MRHCLLLVLLLLLHQLLVLLLFARRHLRGGSGGGSAIGGRGNVRSGSVLVGGAGCWCGALVVGRVRLASVYAIGGGSLNVGGGRRARNGNDSIVRELSMLDRSTVDASLVLTV